MRSLRWLIALIPILCGLLSSCEEPPPPPIPQSEIGPGIGPFDANGHYREDWADDPSKWRRPSPLVKNDAVPSNANPLPPQQSAYKPASHYHHHRSSVRRHTVRRGDTLSGIAHKYHSSVAAIRRANRISGHLIYPGQHLIVPVR